MSTNLFDQEFFELINKETQKILTSLASDKTQQALQEFNQQWLEISQQNITQPSGWIEAVGNLQKQQLGLWQQFFEQAQSSDIDPLPDNTLEVAQTQVFEYIKQSYVVASNLLNEFSANAALPEHEKEKLSFYTKQYTDALSPENFALTNPEVINEAIKTKGQSLVNGLHNLVQDIEKGRISMTDENAFTLGENIAVTEGSVVYENDLFQLIHYKAQGETVHARPTLIIPPCINKYYILDLQPHNSFVKYCVEQGQNTFLVSWINPTSSQGGISWDDYVEKGVINAITRVNSMSNTKTLNAVSWCVGGTLLASALAVLAAKNDKQVQSATFLTTLLDFEEPGEISVFIDKVQIDGLIAKAKEDGVLSGRQLATAFNMLRSNDLIWAYVVNNYLKGKQPAPFDILYWNGDSTNLPYQMYRFYITQMYLENKLCKPNAMQICEQAIDLSKVDTPCYFLSTIGDHIAPWKSTFKGVELLGGKCEFVLGASGHVAGVINPPAKNKRHYWVNSDTTNGADQWLESATKETGSWWPHWNAWLKRRAGKKVPVTTLNMEDYPEIEPAPGRYVKVTLDDM